MSRYHCWHVATIILCIIGTSNALAGGNQEPPQRPASAGAQEGIPLTDRERSLFNLMRLAEEDERRRAAAAARAQESTPYPDEDDPITHVDLEQPLPRFSRST